MPQDFRLDHTGHAFFDNLTGDFNNPGLCGQGRTGTVGMSAMGSRFRKRKERLSHVVVTVHDSMTKALFRLP